MELLDQRNIEMLNERIDGLSKQQDRLIVKNLMNEVRKQGVLCNEDEEIVENLIQNLMNKVRKQDVKTIYS